MDPICVTISFQCSDKSCEEGFPRFERPCHFPDEDMEGKFKCRILCGAGYMVEDGVPNKIKCIGNKEPLVNHFFFDAFPKR